MTLYRPRSVVAAGFTVTSAGSTFTESAPSGALVGDFLQVEGGVDSGVYELATVAGAPVLTVLAHLQGAGPENARVLRDLNDFLFAAGPAVTVTSVAAVDFAALGAQPGDILEIFAGNPVPAGEYVIAEVVAGTLSMTHNVGAGLATGRILRVKR